MQFTARFSAAFKRWQDADVAVGAAVCTLVSVNYTEWEGAFSREINCRM